MKLCQTFRTIASQTWDKLALAKSLSCQISEESFTDFNLLEIRDRHPKNVITITFTKKQESRTGADWEWWFNGYTGLWIGFRIQAKVIDLATNGYKHLHYQLENGTFQSNNLIHSALTSKYPLIPLYCLYSFWEYQDYPDFYRYTRIKGAPEHFGCSVVDAFSILKLRKESKKNIEDLFNLIIPWSYLVCERNPKYFDLAQVAYETWFKIIRDNLNLKNIDLQLYELYANTVQLSLSSFSLRSLRSLWFVKKLRLNKEFWPYLNRIELYATLLQTIKPTERPPDYINQILQNNLVENDNLNCKRITIFSQTDINK